MIGLAWAWPFTPVPLGTILVHKRRPRALMTVELPLRADFR